MCRVRGFYDREFFASKKIKRWKVFSFHSARFLFGKPWSHVNTVLIPPIRNGYIISLKEKPCIKKTRKGSIRFWLISNASDLNASSDLIDLASCMVCQTPAEDAQCSRFKMEMTFFLYLKVFFFSVFHLKAFLHLFYSLAGEWVQKRWQLLF